MSQYRCYTCGTFIVPNLRRSRRCHPDALQIEWPDPGGATSTRPLLSVAYETVCRLNRTMGYTFSDPEEDVEFAGDFPGCTKAQLREALALARKWNLPKFTGEEMPTAPLYGRRQGVEA